MKLACSMLAVSLLIVGCSQQVPRIVVENGEPIHLDPYKKREPLVLTITKKDEQFCMQKSDLLKIKDTIQSLEDTIERDRTLVKIHNKVYHTKGELE